MADAFRVKPANADAVGPRFYRADEVAQMLRVTRAHIYNLAKEDPARLGAEQFGRCVRFRRDVIDGIADGA